MKSDRREHTYANASLTTEHPFDILLVYNQQDTQMKEAKTESEVSTLRSLFLYLDYFYLTAGERCNAKIYERTFLPRLQSHL